MEIGVFSAESREILNGYLRFLKKLTILHADDVFRANLEQLPNPFELAAVLMDYLSFSKIVIFWCEADCCRWDPDLGGLEKHVISLVR